MQVVMRYHILTMICVAFVLVQLLASCTSARATHAQDYTQGSVYGEIYLYDTNYVDEYIGSIRLDVTEQNGQVAIKKDNPNFPNFLGYRLYATYNWANAKISYHPSANIDYTIQAQLQFFLYFEDDKQEFINVPQYNATVQFTKIRGQNKLRADILYDGIKDKNATKPLFVKGDWPVLDADYILELRPL